MTIHVDLEKIQNGSTVFVIIVGGGGGYDDDDIEWYYEDILHWVCMDHPPDPTILESKRLPVEDVLFCKLLPILRAIGDWRGNHFY